ncbi:AMP-binding protein [Cupriavidus malaysiensis]|uniref:AMP-dependent synthetase n=1 Tax=Cupriavidus malaysiensis TaxID=367825 RepID=A0ABM6FDF3_9BURK|nr:AMP-binding protein [Cupriavidus malaysiensis]AOZ09816.1 AMP-dependent synthetase [Cupriavidus malaysiensis]
MREWRGVSGTMAALAGLPAPARARPVAGAGAAGWDADTFLARARAWRQAFAARPGTRWALYLDGHAEFAAALFGAWHAGKHVVLPGDALPATVAALRGGAGAVDGLAGELPGGLLPAPAGLPEAAGSGEAAAWPPLDARHCGLTLFTSGSSGVPQAVPKQLRQLEAEVAALEAAFGAALPDGAQVLCTVAPQHIYGLLFCVLWPLAAGRPMPLARLAFHEELVAQAAALDGPALLVSSPAHLRRLPEELDWAPARRALRAVFSSGGPLPAQAASDALRHLGQAPIEVFGSSETGGIAWRQQARQQERWSPLPGVDWCLRDGLLAVRSDHLPDAGWHVCADLAQPAADGGFVLAGRADRIAKIEEKRVSLSAVERALAATPLVQEARVTLLELAVGTRLAAVVVPAAAGQAVLAAQGRAGLAAALREALADTVDTLALPRRWRFPAALPCNAQGKTSDAMLRALFRRVLPEVRWLDGDGDGDGATATAELYIDGELAVFDGHFPRAPIVPGVAQVEWVMQLAPQRLPVPPRTAFQRLDVLKFQAVIVPGSTVALALTWQAERATLAFRLSSAAGTHASGRIVFGATHD